MITYPSSAVYEDRMRELRNEDKAAKKQKEKEEREKREKMKRDEEIRTYADIQRQSDLYTSNTQVDENYEDEFM